MTGGPIISRRCLTALAGAALTLPFEARANSRSDAPLPDERIDASRDRVRRFTVPVSVNGAAPRPFVVDTGANRSVIADTFAAELGLRDAGRAVVHGITGPREARLAHVEVLRTGGVHLRQAVLPVLPRAALGVDGLLALDTLIDRRVTLDLREGRLIIARSAPMRQVTGPAFMGSDAVTVRGEHRSGQLTVLRGRMGPHRLDVFVDTGAQLSIGNLAMLVVAAAMTGASPVDMHEAEIVGATGDRAPATVAPTPMIHIGALRFARGHLPFARLHTFALWGLTERPALIMGMDLLRAFRQVTLDLGEARATFADAYTLPLQQAQAQARSAVARS